MRNIQTMDVMVSVEIETRDHQDNGVVRYDVNARVGALPLLASSNGHYPTEQAAFEAGQTAACEWAKNNKKPVVHQAF